MDAYTVAAPDAIAAFAVPNPGSSSRGSRFFRVWWLSELPRQADHPAYFGSVCVTGPILSTVDNSTLLLPKPECSDVDHKSHLGGAKLTISVETRLRTGRDLLTGWRESVSGLTTLRAPIFRCGTSTLVSATPSNAHTS